ncbi:4'-phosphopantetheinyl transferase superfamily protein [Variovorax sp. CCNWLW225]|jgi:4'-phosphopantetheinyl transferase|uniref:4'-phosphopantetheinyl transferase family protein n=1 Tax=unclassified Variovorax TaxID=663243 RepID=UPI00215BA684|nr:4'-phosphopantetheinyl transferase superfamily protein [Variovorax sp. S12S4]MCR8961198.1 4'-phosphopantetheinyl transferase superfamily protein [Variovorax sp. S12S4]
MGHAAFALSSVDAPLCRYFDLDDCAGPGAALILSKEERTRAGQFRFPQERQRYVAAHAALRYALAEQTGARADALRFTHSAFGKPSLLGWPRVHFSLSHSQGLGLIAIGERGPLGVDVEQLRPVPDALALAATHFTRLENEALRALPANERDQAFLTCWTRKEACLKAIGLGLIVPPERFEVGVDADCRSVEVPVAGRILWLVLQPAPSRMDSVGSIAEWRQTHTRASVPRGATESFA